MPDPPASGQPSPGMLRYRTEMQDAGIPMPAASASMPIPSYAIDESLKFWSTPTPRQRAAIVLLDGSKIIMISFYICAKISVETYEYL